MALFTGGYLLLAIFVAVGRANYEFLIYIGSILVVLPVIAVTHAKIRLTGGALWSRLGPGRQCPGLLGCGPMDSLRPSALRRARSVGAASWFSFYNRSS